MSINSRSSGQRDWFLIAIVAAIAVLIVVGLVMALRPVEPATYRPDTTPEGVAFNYLLALQRQEYGRAYDYLSADIPNPPTDAGEFFADIEDSFSCTDQQELSNRFQIEESETVMFDDRAIVTASQTVYTRGDLFSRGSYTSRFNIDLKEEGGEWRITSSDRCWSFDWNREDNS